MVSSQQKIPLHTDSNTSYRISLYALENYTDTPQAGLRAANIVEGVLLANGFEVLNHIRPEHADLSTQLDAARKEHADYLLTGGVSEWRYKTGIDGEPAVSLQCKLIETNSSRVVWSATASHSSWGNASIGTTALNLIESMFAN